MAGRGTGTASPEEQTLPQDLSALPEGSARLGRGNLLQRHNEHLLLDAKDQDVEKWHRFV